MSETSKGEDDAYELGLDRGWDHANFVKAYGKEHDRRGPDYPARLTPESRRGFVGRDATARAAESQAFARGWREGRKRFARGQYPDGTKIGGK